MREKLIELSDRAIRAVQKLVEMEQMKNSAKELQGVGNTLSEKDLRVGAVGISSAGKTTFINALMGEDLLPRESRATTNLLVHCGWGPNREVVIQYEDGKRKSVGGDELNQEFMRSVCSETGNPNNKLGIQRIEWRSPSSRIPKGTVLVDTPGLDAYGHEEHEELTLRQFLPAADLILYVSSASNGLKEKDLELMNKIVDYDQECIFVLTHSDLIKTEYEQGRVHRTREEKLEEIFTKFKKQIGQFRRLSDSAIQFVDSIQGLVASLSGSNEEWSLSGFESLVSSIEEFVSRASQFRDDIRARHLQFVIESLIKQLSAHVKKSITPEIKTTDENNARVEYLKYKSPYEEAVSKAEHQSSQWTPKFDASARTSELRNSLQDITDVDSIRNTYSATIRGWSNTFQSMLSSLDTAKTEIESLLRSVDVPAESRHTIEALSRTPMPSANDYSHTYSERVRVRDWGFRWPPWPKHKMQDKERIDVNALIGASSIAIQTQCSAAKSHIVFWKNYYITPRWIAPLKTRYESAQTHYFSLKDDRELTESACQTVQSMIKQLDSIQNELSHLIIDFDQSPQASRDSSQGSEMPDFSQFETDSRQDTEPEPKSGSHRKTRRHESSAAASDLKQLLLACFESRFQAIFESIVNETRTDALAQTNVLLLGRNREHNLELLRRLAHRPSLRNKLASIPDDHWIATDDVQLPMQDKVSTLKCDDVKYCLLDRLCLVVAPADARLPTDVNWSNLFEQFTCIGVQLDAPQIASGLSDLHKRTPYINELSGVQDRLLLISSMGSHFDCKLWQLVDIALHDELRDLNNPKWFVFSQYDARYTTFIENARYMVESKSFDKSEFRRRWREQGCAESRPFTTQTVYDQLSQIELKLAGKNT